MTKKNYKPHMMYKGSMKKKAMTYQNCFLPITISCGAASNGKKSMDELLKQAVITLFT